MHHRDLLASLVIVGTATAAAVAAPAGPEAPDRTSPFTAVRWEGETPMVEIDGQWYGLESIDGIRRARLLDFCKKEHGKSWQKRFSEDLVEVMRAMGQPAKVQVALVLSKDGKKIERLAAMTEDNRRKVWRFNRDGQGAGSGPSGAAASGSASATGGASGPAARAPGVPELAAAIANARAKAPRKAYGFEAARIVYKYSGAFEGTETFYVASHGDTLLLDRNKKVGEWERKTSFCRESVCTMVDHIARRTWTQRIKPADMDLSVMHANDNTLKMVGLLRKGNETVAGRPCVLYENKNGDKLWRSWRWQGIELKIEMKNWSGMSYVKEATEVKEGAPIPEALTKIPDGYKRT